MNAHTTPLSPRHATHAHAKQQTVAWARPAWAPQRLDGARPVVELVSSAVARRAVNRLLCDRYDWRGYGRPTLPPQGSRRFRTLGLRRGASWLATLTVGWDADTRFVCEARCPDAVQQLRARGSILCELTRLASSLGAGAGDDRSGLQQLTALFDAATLTALDAGCDTALLEVNPRHVGFYRRITGAWVIAEPRHHDGACATAVPMALDIQRAHQRLQRILCMPLAA